MYSYSTFEQGQHVWNLKKKKINRNPSWLQFIYRGKHNYRIIHSPIPKQKKVKKGKMKIFKNAVRTKDSLPKGRNQVYMIWGYCHRHVSCNTWTTCIWNRFHHPKLIKNHVKKHTWPTFFLEPAHYLLCGSRVIFCNRPNLCSMLFHP
jgi:hypothetical protein